MKTLILLVLFSSLVFAQTVTTARMDGTVTDPQGATVGGAGVTVVDSDTAADYKATTDVRGHWVVPALPQGSYRVTITMAGFRTSILEQVRMDAGVPVTVNTTLQLGQVSDTVTVTSTADLVQATNATLNTAMERVQVEDLPNSSRSGLDLLISLPGVQTTGGNSSSTMNGLPNNAMNITFDGINMQDYNKNSTGWFSRIPLLLDALDEVTMSTSAATADSNGEGAAQIKFITKSGSNQFHGGVFEQLRNTDLNANSYFNTLNQLPRSIVKLNQFGFHVGGPFLKNKLFFFTDVEFLRQPTSTAYSRTVLNTSQMSGSYTYLTSGKLNTVNVLSLAKAAGFNAVPDTIISNTLNQIASYYANGILSSNVSTGDYNRSTLRYTVPANTANNMSVSRLDYIISSRNQVSLTYSYSDYNTLPDTGNSIVPMYPGTGDVVGTNINTGQHGLRIMGSATLRSTLTSHMTNELRGGFYAGSTIFRDGLASDAPYAPWKGYVPNFGFSLSGVTASASSSRRASPPLQFSDNVTYLHGAHMISFGGNYTQTKLWYQTVASETIPQVTFGAATGDPVTTGSAAIFTATSFPGATQTQLNDAAALYALLTGRVSSITRQVVLGPNGQYGNTPQTDNIRQPEFGFFAQDTWKARPGLSVVAGMRYEEQLPVQDLTGTYSTVSLASLWGLSGIGNMFKPGVMTGVTPTYIPLKGNNYSPLHKWLPSVGLAWQIPAYEGFLRHVLGKHDGASVLRAGYSIASVREGASIVRDTFDSNQGLLYSTSVDPTNYPTYFGTPGSVLFSQATLPSRPYPTSPAYPLTPTGSNSLTAFDPHLKLGYVQSWNIGFQRELGKDNVVEMRYTGNHGLHEWRQENLNEVNMFENGFLNECYIAQNNLRIARGGNLENNQTVTNFGNQGLAGQQSVPILSTAFGSTTTSTYATDLRLNRMGSIASAIYSNATYMGNLTKAGYPANFFVVNPTVASGGSYLIANGGESYYNALQIEFRRRMAKGLNLQASYVWGKSLANGAVADNDDSGSPTTFRNPGLDKVPAAFDIRQAIKFSWVYQLPFGPGRHFLGSSHGVIGRVLEGWEINAVGRVQSGSPASLNTGLYGMNNKDNGIVLYNITAKQLQNMVSIRKTTGANGIGLVYFLPASLIANSQAAFEANGLTRQNLDATAPYIGPQLAPNTFGYRVYLYSPWRSNFDVTLLKRTRIHEHIIFELRASAFDLFNHTSFGFGTVGASSAAFGQTTSADNSTPYRIIDLQARITF